MVLAIQFLACSHPVELVGRTLVLELSLGQSFVQLVALEMLEVAKCLVQTLVLAVGQLVLLAVWRSVALQVELGS